VQHMLGLMVLFLRESMHFSRRCAPKNVVHISAAVTLTFDLVISKLLCQLFLTWVTSPEALNVIRCSIFKLTVSMGQTERWTDRLIGSTRNAA